jgi:ATP-binding cassette subfamily C (CFTR/MRP) protein 1
MNCIVQLIILCVMGKYLTVTVPVLVVVLFFVQNYYLRTSRQVRLLDIEAKSPLFTHFVETMQGISVIRAMHWQAPFQGRLEELLNQSQKPFYMLYCIQQWLQLVLDCIVMALAVILVTLVISLKDQFSAGAIGVALNLILSFNQDLMLTIRFWTSLETSIGAVSRIQDFVANTPPEDQGQNVLAPAPEDWPSRGEIIFNNVKATYK